MTSTPEEEAYLLGCLLARGSIGVGTQGQYEITLRVPYREYQGVETHVIKLLQKNPQGLTLREISSDPAITASSITPQKLTNILSDLSDYSPPHKPSPARMLQRDFRLRWKILTPALVTKFLEWQERYYARDLQNMRLIMGHLKDTATFLSRITIPVTDEDRSRFGISYHGLRCEIPEFAFDQLKKKYGITLGDVFAHARISDAIRGYDIQAMCEFIRGLADCEADFDVYRVRDIYRVQFSVVPNENRTFPVQLCELLQTKMNIPVYYVDWAIPGLTGRGSRDQLVKIFATYFDDGYFPPPLFYNAFKEAQLREYIEFAKKKHWVPPGKCPRSKSMKKGRGSYKMFCKQYGCSQIDWSRQEA